MVTDEADPSFRRDVLKALYLHPSSEHEEDQLYQEMSRYVQYGFGSILLPALFKDEGEKQGNIA